jgi:hypothetical protein
MENTCPNFLIKSLTHSFSNVTFVLILLITCKETLSRFPISNHFIPSSRIFSVNYESIFRSNEVAPFTVQDVMCRNVGVLRIFPSIPIESVQAVLRPPTQGVVLETYGMFFIAQSPKISLYSLLKHPIFKAPETSQSDELTF